LFGQQTNSSTNLIKQFDYSSAVMGNGSQPLMGHLQVQFELSEEFGERPRPPVVTFTLESSSSGSVDMVTQPLDVVFGGKDWISSSLLKNTKLGSKQ
jgi:hypothetical protein